MLATCGNGTGGHNHHLMTLSAKMGALPDQFNHMCTVESQCAPCQNAGSQLHNDGL
ncbi:hypothetical protein PSSHI_00660 [Photobacterium sp. R1]